MVILVDTHAHLSDEDLWSEREDLIRNAEEAGVGAVLNVGFDRATSQRGMEWARSCPRAAPAVGIHPNNILGASEEDFARVREWAPFAAAIGETGLDFYWDATPVERQREIFRWHLAIAEELQLPVTIHSRNAEAAVLEELGQFPSVTGALHCFGGTREEAARGLEMGLYVGIGGPVTFKKALDLQELVRWLPIDRILVETDSPYLSPHPFRGKRNEPSRVRLVAEKVSELKNLPLEEVAAITTANAFRLYPGLQKSLSTRSTRRASI